MIKYTVNNEELDILTKELFAGLVKSGKQLTINAEQTEGFWGYELERSNKVATIRYSDKPAFFCAMNELIARSENEYLSVKHRSSQGLGIMVDCSRNAVMKIDRLKLLVRKLAQAGFTYIQLYTEDTYEVEGEPFFGYQRGRYSIDEIKELDDYCDTFGIELVPCIQTLAHLGSIFNWENRYEDIRDNGDILCLRDDRTYELIEKMLQSVRKAFRSKRINLGMDEAHLLGAGKFMDRNGFVPRIDLMKEHLSRVIDLCKKYGFRPSMWNDMFYRMAGSPDYYTKKNLKFTKTFIKGIPDIDMIYWDYYNEDPDVYRNMVRTGKEFGKRLSFAGGAWRWACLAPQNNKSYRNTTVALGVMREEGIDDIMVTCWGDNGCECPIFAVLSSIILYSELTYGESIDEVTEIKAKNITGYTWSELRDFDLPNLFGSEDPNEHQYVGNSSRIFLYSDPFAGIVDYVLPEGGVRTRCLQNADRMKELGKAESPFNYIFRNYELLCKVLADKADLGTQLREAYQSGNKKELKRLANSVFPKVYKELENYYVSFRKMWLTDNKENGLEVIDMRIGGLLLRLKYGRELINDYVSGKTDKIDKLEGEALVLDEKAKGTGQALEMRASKGYTACPL